MAGFAGVRRSELVREYAEDQALEWEDVDWQKQLITVRHEVAKQTSRKNGQSTFYSNGSPVASLACSLSKGGGASHSPGR
jgi:hypothetical protein